MKNARWTWGVFAASVLLAALPLLIPEPKTEFDYAGFACLPVLEGGRVKPIDSFARNSLLMIRSKQSVPVDGHSLNATRWLLDSAFKPESADTYPTFVVDDPEVLGLLKLENKGRYFPYWQIEPQREEVGKQAQAADELESGRRSRFQEAVLNLHRRLTLYERVKNTFMVSGQEDPAMELAAFSAVLPTALRAYGSRNPGPNEISAMKTLAGLLERYRFISSEAAFKALPPQAGEHPDAWTNAGEAVTRPGGGMDPHPALATFALMGRAYRGGDAIGFNAAVAEHAAWLQANRPAVARSARVEVLVNRAQPFISGLALYLAALLLVFASWAWKKPELPATAAGAAWAAFAVHTLGLLARTALQGRPPVTNLYSSAVFVGWAAALLGLVAERVHRRGFGTAAACTVGFSTLLIAHHLTGTGDTMEMMRAVLDSNFWLATHVVAITIGYSSTYLAGLLGIAWVIRRHVVRRPDPEASKALASLAYGIICFSLMFSFVGTVLGGIWADQSWGRFWGWDPKENGALLIVLWNSLILHARWGGYARERGMMLLALFGNVIVSLSWFGVNMLGLGLHSYGFMDKAFWWLAAFTASQIALILLGLMPPRFWEERAAR